MQFNSPATELTTAGTDALLALVCACLIPVLSRFRAHSLWKARLWTCVLGLLVLASILGAIAHGFDLSPAWRNFLWQPLYLALGVCVALFVVGGICDWRGEGVARRLFAGAVLIGGAFYCVTLLTRAGFVVFVAYEGLAMAAALTIYLVLAVRKRLPGATIMVLAIALNMLAASLQASSVRITVIWPFDHNGVFHMAQIAALLVLGLGLHTSMSCHPHEPDSVEGKLGG